MSLPQFDVQGSLFESLGAIAPDLFTDNDKYKLFAKKVCPVLEQCRSRAVFSATWANADDWARASLRRRRLLLSSGKKLAFR